MPDFASPFCSDTGETHRRSRTDPANLLALIERMRMASTTDAYSKPPVAISKPPMARTG